MSKTAGREKDVRTTSAKGKPITSSQGSQREMLNANNAPAKAAAVTSYTTNSSAVPKTAKEPGSSHAASKSGGKEESRLTEWKNFFLDSGIPDHASAEYAAIFVKERINWQILKNLDKGYLTDMGINCIGDQIAILQAAKRYCGEQYHPSNTGTLFKPPVEANGSDIMEVEETVHHSNNSPRNQNSNTVASEVPQASQAQNTTSNLPVRRTIRSEIRSSASLPTVRSVTRIGQTPEKTSVQLRLKRSADDESDLRTIIKRPSFTQNERTVREVAPVDTSFTIRMGAGPGVRRDVFSRLNPKGAKTSNNTSLVRVLETKMSRLTTDQSSSGSSNGPTRPTLVSDTIDEPNPVFNRLGGGEGKTSNNRAERPADVRTSGSTVFSRLGYQTSKNRIIPSVLNNDTKPKLSVHERLGSRF